MDVSSEDFDLLANRLTDIYSALDNIDNALLNRWDRDSLAKDIFVRRIDGLNNSGDLSPAVVRERLENYAQWSFDAANAFLKVLEAQK